MIGWQIWYKASIPDDGDCHGEPLIVNRPADNKIYTDYGEAERLRRDIENSSFPGKMLDIEDEAEVREVYLKEVEIL